MKVINDFKGEYRFLSNFAKVNITYKGLTYPNAEAAFQAQKCVSDDARLKYTKPMSPVIAKRMGKKEPGLPENWNEIAYDIMLDILRVKFSDENFKQKLLETGEAYLEEGNCWHDNRWGRCTCQKCQTKSAQNFLGKILMQIRTEIQSV